MPLFGRKDDKAQNADALQADLDRLHSMPLPRLAAEVMRKGFGPGCPGADEDETVTIGGPNINAGATVRAIASEMSAARDGGVDQALALRFDKLVAEGVQALEHASLVRAQMHTAMNSFDYALTRLGREALKQNTVERALGADAD